MYRQCLPRGDCPRPRCYPLSYHSRVVRLLCVDEMCSTQWTICVPSRHYWNCARKMKGRLLCRCGPRPSVSSRGARTASCLFRRIVTAQLSFLLSTLLLDMKHDATNRFMRDTVRCCYSAEGFLLLHHTMYYCRPKFSGNAVCRVFWPWSPFGNNRRRAGAICFVVSEHVLDLEI